MSIKRKQSLQTYGKGKRRQQCLIDTNKIPNNLSSTTTPDSMFFPPTDQIDNTQKPLPPLPPNKPRMPAEPNDDDIKNLISFCEALKPISRPDAIRYLKAKNNNLEDAFNAFFNDEDITQQEQAMTWDEGAWSQGKEGNTGDGNHDPHLRPLLSSTAPTRANSPAPGRNTLHPSTKQQEDDDVARAIAMSQGGAWPQQESGIVGHGGQETQFGPANRNDYNMQDWAMVPSGQAAAGEIVPDAEAEERVGKPGEPRMLKQLPGGEYLANLLTICANVSGARESMLMRERVKADYGSDAEWWKGHLVAMARIVSLGDGAPAQEEEGDQYDDLVAEVQRLTAFLTASGRSYGSAGALAQTEALKNADTRSVKSNTLLELFMQTWPVAAVSKMGPESGLASLFTTTVGTNAHEGMEDTDMTLIDMPVDATSDNTKSQDLLELLDGLLWDTSDPDVNSDNYIERPAEVLVMRLRQRGQASNSSGQLKVVVPPEFCVDKYMREHIASTRATRTEMAKGKQKVEKIESIRRKLQRWRNPKDGKELDAADLLGHTVKYFNDSSDLTDSTRDLTDKLTALVSSIESKLATLVEEKEKTLQAIASMSHAPPPGLSEADLEHRYYLRGVSTKPNITYVLAHQDSDDSSEEDDPFDDADDNTYAGMRWWRLEYEVSASGLGAKVHKTRVGDYDVLRAVELEHSSALLVYGSLHINTLPAEGGLPAPLQKFVADDNALFATELEAERSKPPAYQPPAGPPPTSFDMTDRDSGFGGEGEGEGRRSMDSTKAEGGFSRPNTPGLPDYGDVGQFERGHGFGLGPDFKSGNGGGGMDGVVEEDDAPVHEIRLPEAEGDGNEGNAPSPPTSDLGVPDGAVRVEMVEKAHGSLVPGLGDAGKGGKEPGSDVEMGNGGM